MALCLLCLPNWTPGRVFQETLTFQNLYANDQRVPCGHTSSHCTIFGFMQLFLLPWPRASNRYDKGLRSMTVLIEVLLLGTFVVLGQTRRLAACSCNTRWRTTAHFWIKFLHVFFLPSKPWQVLVAHPQASRRINFKNWRLAVSLSLSWFARRLAECWCLPWNLPVLTINSLSYIFGFHPEPSVVI